MNIRTKIAKWLSPGLKGEADIREMVLEEVQRAKASMPVQVSYDPHGEGYRPMIGANSLRQDLAAIDIDRMMEVAYYMWDHSAMTKRMAKMDKGFLFAEPVTVTSSNENVNEILSRFWKRNKMDLRMPIRAMWLGMLGSQVWPVEVNKQNGDVYVYYADPMSVSQVFVGRLDVEQAVQVEFKGYGGRQGEKKAVIREDRDFRSKTMGRLVGDCFYYAVNNPPNDPRGRSDYYALFDWIDGLERYGYNYLERAEFLLNFVWDITLNGYTEDQIREWLRNNPPPEPGSQRAHNENVTWAAVAPDIKATDFSQGFEMGKSFIMGAAGRPESWFGGGGKAYHTEAEQFGQVPIKDLDERQLLIKTIIEEVCRFQVDQSVIHGRLSEADAEEGFEIGMPEISKKDLTALVNGIPQLATALVIAENQGWLAKETAAMAFGMVAGQIGMEVDVQEEMERARKKVEDADAGITEDYAQI